MRGQPSTSARRAQGTLSSPTLFPAGEKVANTTTAREKPRGPPGSKAPLPAGDETTRHRGRKAPLPRGRGVGVRGQPPMIAPPSGPHTGNARWKRPPTATNPPRQDQDPKILLPFPRIFCLRPVSPLAMRQPRADTDPIRAPHRPQVAAAADDPVHRHRQSPTCA